MNKIEHERLTEQLIGEAAFTLLQKKGPINKQSLTRQLQQMASHEVDSERRAFIAGLVAELSSDGPSFFKGNGMYQSAEQNSDNVYPIFGENTVSVIPRKH
ncbi:hypothetical protein [Erwinia sp. SLM-02]|uniref:hypothetical protein n=1 Tax=Erwinia sp. SLM-02 TaxID=3020057 RepID=UPI003080DE0F